MAQRKPAQPSPKKSKIPEFATIQEEAAFWDTHDVTEFLDETTPVKLVVRDPLESLIAVQLSPDEQETLNKIAEEEGVRPEKLVHDWVIERLKKSA